MTTREQVRPGRRLMARERLVIPEVRPTLGEELLVARERKGVDLYRAERDTKIRARYLSALERDDYLALPGTVYTKGFLRNYALYLGLDPEDVLLHYRQEYGSSRTAAPVAIVPRALEAPSRGLTFSRGVLVAAILSLLVITFIAYVGFQVVRSIQPPALAIGSPATRVTTLEGNPDSTVLSGTSDPGMTVTIQGVGQPFQVSADTSGHWQQQVPRARGQNECNVTATNPSAGKQSLPVMLIITVPMPIIEAPTLQVSSPNDGAAVTNGAIPIQGRTNATSVTVSARYVGPAPVGASSAAASGAHATAKASPGVTATPAAKVISVGPNGAFSDSYQLPAGKWLLTITAAGSQRETTTEHRAVTVAFTGIDVVVAVKGAPTWIKAWVDGRLDPTLGSGGLLVQPGKTVELTGQRTVEVRTGSAGSTSFTVNGEALGTLGPDGAAQTWRFTPSTAPARTSGT